ncbi:MAG: MATE family efflux transporter [Firmicutes bacterium]|nr:MATE family efflux transporter [Bacillota bacterium]
MAKDRTELILSGNMYRVLVTLSIPIIINSLIQQLYSLVDSLWVSRISSVHFAAVTFVWPINWLLVSLGAGFGVAGTSLLSQLLGGGQQARARTYAAQLLAASVLFSLALSIVGYVLAPFVVRLMGATGDLAELGTLYLQIVYWDLPFMFLALVINGMLHAQGDTITPTILSGVSAALNAVLDPIFIFTLNWGLAGAAWATVVSRAFLAVAAVVVLLRGGSKVKPSFARFRFEKQIMQEIGRVGLPASIGQSGAALGFAVFNGLIASYGTATLAAYGMVNRITSLLMQPAMGTGQALTAIVGQNLGADQMSRVKESFFKAVQLAVLIGGVGCAVLFLFGEPIILFFMQARDDPAVITESLNYLTYVSVSLPFMGIISAFAGLYQGTGNTKYAMNMEVGRLWFVRLPMIVLLGRFTSWGSTGIWFSMSFSNFLISLYGYWIYRTRPWLQGVLAKQKQTEAKPLSAVN